MLIYVFDVESREADMDVHYYQTCLDAILKSSSKAKIFCLIHKMDLIAEDQRDLIFEAKAKQLEELSLPLSCSCFRTSIWDETLYKAWSSIVHMLIPNVGEIEKGLGQFAEISGANEVLLFERNTFLVIAHSERKPHRDQHRFEKISNIIKQFKLSCSKLASQFTVSHLAIYLSFWLTVLSFCSTLRCATKTFQRLWTSSHLILSYASCKKDRDFLRG